MNDPKQAKYQNEVNALLQSEEYMKGNRAKKQDLIGNLIYEYVEEFLGEEDAPKLTGMIIDLPDGEQGQSILTLNQLKLKLQIGLDLLRKE